MEVNTIVSDVYLCFSDYLMHEGAIEHYRIKQNTRKWIGSSWFAVGFCTLIH